MHVSFWGKCQYFLWWKWQLDLLVAPGSAGEQADFLISGSETYEYVTHISVFSEILAIELITCSVTKLTPRM